MNRIASLTLAAVLALSLAGCSSSGSTPPTSPDTVPSASSDTGAPAPTTAPADAATATETPTPTTDPVAFTIECYDWIADETSLVDTLNEAWKVQGDDVECKAAMDTTVDLKPTRRQQKAIDAYRAAGRVTGKYSDSESFQKLLQRCLEPEDTMDYAHRKVQAAVLIMCPDIPYAKRIKLLSELSYMPDDGEYDVGSEIAPGTWRTGKPMGDCYWERLSGGGDILANNFVSYARNGVTVTIYTSDAAFSTEGCGDWRRIS